MRFSPTLLACCTAATLFGLPVFAADATDVAESSTTDAMADDTALTTDTDEPTGQLPETADVQIVSLQQSADDAVGPAEATTTDTDTDDISEALSEALEPAPDELQVAQDPTETPEETLERLLEGIGRPSEPLPAEETDEPDVTPTPDVPASESPAPDQEVVEEEPAEVQVLVAELDVVTLDGSPLDPALEDIVYQAITLRPSRLATRSQLQEDINNIFATGFFANVRAQPEDTDLGVRVTFGVQPNPILTNVIVRTDSLTGDVSLLDEEIVEPSGEDDTTIDETPSEVEARERRQGLKRKVDEIFGNQTDDVLNLLDLQDGILALNNWYDDQGYFLARVTAAPQVSDDGVVTLIVSEGVVESIEVRYIDEDGEVIEGKTRPFIIIREFQTEPGDVLRRDNLQADLARVNDLGIFGDIPRPSFEFGEEDPSKVKVVVNISEGDTGSVGAAVGFNLTGDVFGSISYQQDNFGGNNQKLRTEVQLSERDLLFDVSFTDPWIAGDPHRTSYTVNGFNRRSISLIFDGGDTDIDLPNGDTPRVNRVGGGVSFARPLDNGWSSSVGLEYQRISIRDSDGDLSPEDQLGNDLSFSGSGRDDLLSIPVSFVWDQRNDSLVPNSGSLLRLGSEQTVPVGNGTIFFNRLRASYSRYIPVKLLSFGEGPQTLALNVQGGTVIGDLPPYEAFSLGGTNSVRGFDEGDLGSGRSFVQATAEYRFPLFTSFLGGALFVDYGSDLGSGTNVPGDPAEIRGKPGNGFGYGAGIRVQTPLGALRLDYGIGNDGDDGRIHFGIGERF
ncbi:MAG: BamA/TamA family outer membrane protein [Cyanobacteria bacterium P01_A01_bin.137]